MENNPVENIKKQYFPNLDGLRFLMALFVATVHIEDIKIKNGRENFMGGENEDHYYMLAKLTVTAFFVMSGFLITYILMRERENTSNINVLRYYKRRILKIWPLYFFILFLSFFVLPHFGSIFTVAHGDSLYRRFWLKLVFAIFFLPPILSGGLTRLPNTLGPIWSIRVEEFFYIFWPLLLKKSKNFLKLCLWIIGGYLFLRVGVNAARLVLQDRISPFHLRVIDAIRGTLYSYRISSMAIGGIGAYLVLLKKEKILTFIYRKDFQWAVYLLTGIMLVAGIYIPVISNEIYSALFCIIMVNLATNPKSILYLDYKWMRYLGKITYGIYLYNSITRIVSLELVEKMYGVKIKGWQMETVMYVCTILLTITVAAISFELLEKPFLKMKKKSAIARNSPE